MACDQVSDIIQLTLFIEIFAGTPKPNATKSMPLSKRTERGDFDMKFAGAYKLSTSYLMRMTMNFSLKLVSILE